MNWNNLTGVWTLKVFCILFYKNTTLTAAPATAELRLLCSITKVAFIHSFILFLFSDQRRITMQLFLPAEDIITISTSNKEKPKMKSITNADMYAKRTKSSIKRNTFKQITKASCLGKVFEFLSFSQAT